VPISTNEAPADGRIEDGDIVIAVVFVSRGAARLRDVIWRPS
jgi:hypothetical protein